MTTQEAITYLELYKLRLKGSVGDLQEDVEAFNNAIDALKATEEIKKFCAISSSVVFPEEIMQIIDKHIRKE